MPNAANGLLQLGLLGAGPIWQRLRAALTQVQDLYRVAMVADDHRHRADDAAAEQRCPVAPSAGKLVHHPEVDALLLADPQWHGLWAMEEAIAAGKPVLSAVPLAAEPEQLERLRPKIESAERTVHFVEPWNAPLLARRLHDLFAAEVGPVRHLAAELRGPLAPLPNAGLARLLHFLGSLLDRPPARATRLLIQPQAAVLAGEWSGGASLVAQHVAGSKSRLHLRLLCSQGEVEVLWPRKLAWRVGTSRHRERLPSDHALTAELVRFHDLVWSGQRDERNWEEAMNIARLFAGDRSPADKGSG